MAGVISIALKAVDQYSGVLTGLNQGFELVNKALGAIKGAADLAFSAISDGVALAAKGGNYAEMRRQFNNVAMSFGVNGQAILDSLDKITAGMLDLPTATRLAGKGISAGLSDKQIETAFTFIKRRTELTGESFDTMAEQVFTALQSGRYSVLKQMGLVVESGAKVGDVMNAITAATKNYGDAGYNAADNIATLSNQQDKFSTAIGVAINETPLFQKALQAITDTVTRLVTLFDPRPLSVFFDVFGQLFFDLVRSAASIIPGLDSVFSFIDDLLAGTAAQSGELVKAIGNGLFSIVRTVANVGNTILQILDTLGIITFVQYSVDAIINIVRYATKIVTTLTAVMVGNIVDGLSEAARLIRETAIAFPTIAGTLGTDLVGLAEFEVAMNKAGWLVRGLEESANKATDSASDFFQNLNASAALAAKNGFDVDSIDEMQESFLKRISEIDFSKSWGDALSPKGAGGLQMQAGVIDSLAKIEAPAAMAAEKIGEKMGVSLAEATGESLYNNWDKITQAIPENALLDPDKFKSLTSGQRELLRREQEIQEKRIRDRLIFEFNLRQSELDAASERAKRDDPIGRVQEFFATANWPAEMDAFMRVIFGWLISIAGGERIPLAITTGI
jgi:hypothetical protein